MSFKCSLRWAWSACSDELEMQLRWIWGAFWEWSARFESPLFGWDELEVLVEMSLKCLLRWAWSACWQKRKSLSVFRLLTRKDRNCVTEWLSGQTQNEDKNHSDNDLKITNSAKWVQFHLYFWFTVSTQLFSNLYRVRYIKLCPTASIAENKNDVSLSNWTQKGPLAKIPRSFTFRVYGKFDRHVNKIWYSWFANRFKAAIVIVA